MKRLIAAARCIAAFMVAPAWAQQQGNPAGAMPGLSRARACRRRTSRTWRTAISPAPQRPEGWPRWNSADWRITTVRVQDTRQFGQRMVNDHSKANDQLKELAEAANIPLPNAPGPEDEAIRERLDKMQGDAFDRDYIRRQITAHQETVQLFEYEIGSGQDSQLKNFASQTLPVLMEHLELAQTIDARLSGAAKRCTTMLMSST